MNNDDNTLKSHVMRAIEEGKVRMRPKSHFLLASVCVVAAILLLLFVLSGIASLSIFLLYDTGLWFAPSLGARGWLALLQGLPPVPFALVVVCIGAAVMLVRRFAFGYRRPVVTSVFVVVAFAAAATVILEPYHHGIELRVRHGEMPSVVAMFYRMPFRPVRPPDVFHGSVLATSSNGFVLIRDSGGTTTIAITSRTHLPFGDDFSVGEEVVVIGDAAASSTVRAYGVRDATP